MDFCFTLESKIPNSGHRPCVVCPLTTSSTSSICPLSLRSVHTEFHLACQSLFCCRAFIYPVSSALSYSSYRSQLKYVASKSPFLAPQFKFVPQLCSQSASYLFMFSLYI